MSVCANKVGLYNLQPAGCLVTPGITKKFIFVPYFKADGSINGIDLSSPFAEAQIDALINQMDKNLRWYPTATVSNFVTDRADPITETIDNVDYIVSEGVRTMSGDFLSASAGLAKKINANNAVEVGVFLVDSANGLTGIKSGCNDLNPIRLERNQFGKLMFPTESNVFKVMWSATWSRLITDGDLVTLCYEDHLTDILSKNGLVDVVACNTTVVDASTLKTSFNIPNGSAKGIAFAGLVAGDFQLINETTSATVSITAIAENPDGTYEFSFAAQTTGDIGKLMAAKAGFEFEEVEFTFA